MGQQVLDAADVLPHGTPEARQGLAVGQIFGGIATFVGRVTGEVLGGIATTTGIGATVGVPAIVVSTGLVLGGIANIGAGVRGPRPRPPHPLRPPEGIAAGESWLFGLCAAIAPIAPPRWMPMANVIEAGLSLEHGARGMRSLFTSKPSDKEVNRVRSLGALAVRSLGAVLSATGNFHAEAHLIRATLVASLGLPVEDQRLLNNEAPIAAEALDIQGGGVEAKIAKAIVRGGFFAAMGDGMDPREEQAVVAISAKRPTAPRSGRRSIATSRPSSAQPSRRPRHHERSRLARARALVT